LRRIAPGEFQERNKKRSGGEKCRNAVGFEEPPAANNFTRGMNNSVPRDLACGAKQFDSLDGRRGVGGVRLVWCNRTERCLVVVQLQHQKNVHLKGERYPDAGEPQVPAPGTAAIGASSKLTIQHHSHLAVILHLQNVAVMRDQGVNHWIHKKAQQEPGDDPRNDDDGERLLSIGADAGRKRRGQQS
jgi:hypothetical protein